MSLLSGLFTLPINHVRKLYGEAFFEVPVPTSDAPLSPLLKKTDQGYKAALRALPGNQKIGTKERNGSRQGNVCSEA